MAYDEALAERVRGVLPDPAMVSEQKMFGGLAYMLGGHMFCGVVRDELMLRLGATGRSGRWHVLTCGPWTSPGDR